MRKIKYHASVVRLMRFWETQFPLHFEMPNCDYIASMFGYQIWSAKNDWYG